MTSISEPDVEQDIKMAKAQLEEEWSGALCDYRLLKTHAVLKKRKYPIWNLDKWLEMKT